jgi:hypothetical protein
MSDLKLRERTYRLLEESLPNEQDADAQVRRLLEMEYLRRLAAFRHTDRVLRQKYAMDFREFVDHRVVQRREFSFDVETDAVNWETAVSGIQTMERQLHELRDANETRD